MQYRAEIDGLRALAILPVILFHAGFDLFSGGYVGVDVFFVISGYLIATILIEGLENKKLSIANFYERRARRILPALVFVMMASVPFAWFLLSDAALEKFGSGLIGVSFFLSNVVFWRTQGYFDDSVELNPIVHTWSLAVEEQYYMLFPLFLLLIWRLGTNKVFWIVTGMVVVSLLLSEWGWRNRATANFYLLPTRAWELFMGALAALIVKRIGVQKDNILASLGFILIIISIFLFDKKTPFPSLYTLLPVVGAALIVIYGERETFVAGILGTKILVGLGLISYSAYLWHQPIFAFFRIYTNKIDLGPSVGLALIGITILLSVFSWRFIEKPFRDQACVGKSTLIFSLISGLILLSILGYTSKMLVDGGEYRLAEQLSQNDFVYFENQDERKFVEGRLLYPLDTVKSIVVGSSRVMQINSRIMGEDIQSLTVSGASMEDNIAFGLEALPKLKYENIFISADPWLINVYDDQNRYMSVGELLSFWLRQIEKNNAPRQFLNSKIQRGIHYDSYHPFVSFRNLIRPDNSSRIPRDNKIEPYAKKAYDGSHIYSESYANNIHNIELGFNSILNYAMDDFDYDKRSIELLEKFVWYLKKNGVSVHLVLAPYHPKLYQMMLTQKPVFIEIEQWYRDFAYKNKVRIIGSYDGHAVGCKEDEFYDGMHPAESCMEKLLINRRD